MFEQRHPVLRTCAKINTSIFLLARSDRIVPFGMEFVAGDIAGGHFSVTHFDAFFIDTFIKGTFNFEPSIGRRRTDQLDNGHVIDQRFATPALGDMAEQTVLNLIPFGCSRRIMVHVDDQVLCVGKSRVTPFSIT